MLVARGRSHAILTARWLAAPGPHLCRGIINVRNVGTWAVAVYSVIFGLIAGLHFGLDAVKLARRHWGGGRRCGQEAAPPPSAPPANTAVGARDSKLTGGNGSVSADSSNGV